MNYEADHTEAYRSLCYSDSVFKERYEGWTEIGQGGHAVVARVTSRVLGKDIALKIFTPLAVDDRPRFQREANNAAEVSSPFIVRPMGVFVRGSLGWIEMELVDGPDLGRELERREEAGEPFSLLEALDIAIDVTAGLVHAHQVSLIHRDIKPANIYLPRSRRPAAKLGDFGIARLAESMRLTKTDVFRGTPEWTSPEGADGKALEAPHDVYCLGLTLFSLFTNNGKAIPLPPNATPQAVLRAHLKQAPRSARALNPELPSALDEVLARCLLKRPVDNRPTASRLLEELHAIRQKALRRTPTARVPLPGESRGRRAWMLRGIGALCLVGLGATVWLRRSAPSAPPLPVPSLAAALGSTATLAASAPQIVPGLTASVENRFLRLSIGKESLTDVRLTLIGGQGSYAHRLSEALDADSAAFLSVDDFVPLPPPAETFRELRLEGRSLTGPVDLRIPLP